MRKNFSLQYEIGVTPIEHIKIPKTRDELPPVLEALQYIFKTPEVNKKVFEVLNSRINTLNIGRPGLSLWEILVLGVVRLTLDANYDRLEHIANFDKLVRGILGVENDFGYSKIKTYPLQTLKDNVYLIDEETISKINDIVVEQGHYLKKKEEEKLEIKVDSYVVESNVHFPTDINLLWDAARKCIDLAAKLSSLSADSGWRKHKDWSRRIKNSFIRLNRVAFRGGRNKEARKQDATIEYLSLAKKLNTKLENSKQEFKKTGAQSVISGFLLDDLLYYKNMLIKHIDLVRRRILLNEVIGHEEKVFSLFEPYTEWINKGKAGNKIELGLKTSVCSDQFNFIVHYRIMEHEQDAQAAEPIATSLLEKFDLQSISYDKGYWSKENFLVLEEMIPQVIMPKKGKLNKSEYEREHSAGFKKKRNAHSAIESNINGLEHHGLDRCPDKELAHFKNYIVWGILSYNLHKLGNILQENQRKKEERRQKKPAA